MKPSSKLSRRHFLRLASASIAGAISVSCGSRPAAVVKPDARDGLATALPEPDSGSEMAGMEMPVEQAASPNFKPDVEINLRAITSEQAVFQGSKTRVWRYVGESVQGDSNALQPVADSYLGPVLQFKPGQKVRINFFNDLPEKSIIHWHGLHVPSAMDGLPDQAVGPGKGYVYEFEVNNRPGLYWFHPHPDMRTGFQAYQGLAGLILISGEDEAKLGLPAAEYDLPLVIQDRLIDAQNQWVYPASMMERMAGALGDHILVNGKPDLTLPAAATAYRLRFLNGSNARTYKLAWDDGAPWTVIATDGGLLEKPVSRPYLVLSPGERVEVWTDFSKHAPGSQVKLISQAFDAGSMQGMGGMMNGMNNALPNGSEFSVMTVKIDREGPKPAPLPEVLSHIERLTETDAVNAANPRTFTLSFMHMTWLMNGRTYQMNEVAADEIVKLNTTEAWVFRNAGMMGMMNGMMGGMGMGRMGMQNMNSATPMPGGMMGGMMKGMGGMMDMPHVMHLHGVQFLIVDRRVDQQFQASWQTVKDGLVDEGWKDTFLIMPGEEVKFLVRFTDYSGLYMYHCHIIEHEDMGMMRYYRVDL